MTKGETEVGALLSQLHQRIIRTKRFNIEQLEGDNQEFYRRNHQRIFADKPNYPTVRSEFFAGMDELESVDQEIIIIRDWIFVNGSNYTTHPDYLRFHTDLTRYNQRTEDEWRSLYYFKRPPFSVHADQKPLQGKSIREDPYKDSPLALLDYEVAPSLQENKGDRLYLNIDLNIDNKRANIEIRFGFHNDFILAILFNEGGEYYHSSRLPLDQMTQEEREIIDHCLAAFIAGVVKV